ncbi:MAG: hypothetical protein QW386_04290 [Candidatus Bathyarchaeia archaeon]
MKMNYKKAAKIITLLVTSILIATVSAQIYGYMYIEGSGTITSQELSWQLGSTAPSGATVQGVYVKNLNLSIPMNTPKNFTDCLRLVNNNNTEITFSLEVTSVGDATNFTTFDLVLYNAAGARLATLNCKTTDIKTGLTIPALTTLYIRFEVTPTTDAESGYLYFTVKVTYE